MFLISGMLYTKFGSTGMTVSQYCLGTMMFGSMGNNDQSDCETIIHKAIEAGVTFFDTAGFYSGGEAEEILGSALRGKREQLVLSTKFSTSSQGAFAKPDAQRRQIVDLIEGSLQRLNTDYIDIVQIARFNETSDLNVTLSTLSDLVQQGKIRAYGSSMFSADRIVEAQWVSERSQITKPLCEQLLYSIFSRDIEVYSLPTCQRYGLGVITFSALDGGWLTGRYLRTEDFSKPGRVSNPWAGGEFDPEAEKIQRKLHLLRQLNETANQAGYTLAHMALAFTRTHPAISSTIIGPRTQSQLDDALTCADLELSANVLDRIDEIVEPGSSINGLHFSAIPASLDKKNRRN
jgi:aryl-alcohol dehydrogenase-like predicted oxidoreductase